MICLLCQRCLRECQCADGAVYDLPRCSREAHQRPLRPDQFVVEGGEAFDAPPLRPGMLRIETELRIEGEPVGSVYFSVPREKWQALPEDKRLAIVDGLQSAAVEEMLTVETRVCEPVIDPNQPELFAEAV